MGYIELRKGSDGASFRFKTEWRSEHYAHPKFLEHLCFSGAFDAPTLLDSMSERMYRRYRNTAEEIDYTAFQDSIKGETYVLLVLSMGGYNIIKGIDAYTYKWDSIINTHYVKHIERYEHTSRFYQVDTGFFCHQYPLDKG